MPEPTTAAAATPAAVLDFWLADGLTQGWPSQDMNLRWFTGGPALDKEISQTFGSAVAAAQAGGLTGWEAEPLDRLALVILLDQFTRNVFRGTGQAFGGDARAQGLTLQTLDQQQDRQLPWVGRLFIYMPLMHAEDAALQAKCVACFAQLVDEAPADLKPKLQGSLDFARQHQDIISRFGRFPYRNAALGRASTAAEIAFLRTGPRFGQ
ncbi:MAG: hypothetical protein JWR68_2154 [Polaromonas sp.]|nr:hypothetical protein [Polaromonas sp.]